MTNPVRLTPSLREKVWGKTHLAPWFPNSEKPVGEAWFLGPRELPLLVKFLFTDERLSVQVHPADGEDGPRGKTEMWHILEAAPGATLALGFREPITRERLRESLHTGEVEELLNWMPVSAGQTFFTPAHTVHAIGAGIVLCEIQQNSDITYRLWDYGRPRELHVEQALPICDLGVHPGPSAPKALSPGRDELIRCSHFATELITLRAGEQIAPGAAESEIWIALEGESQVGCEGLRAGDAVLMPREGEQPLVRAETASRFLRTYVP